MSLQVWLPLCGDLRNQGLSAQTSTITTTPTWATVGKIGGKSLYTKTRQTTMYFPNLVGISTYSVAYWLYIPTATAPTAWSDMFGIAFNCAGTTMWERDERRAATTTGRHNYHLAKSTSEGSNTNPYYATREDDSANDNWVHYVLTKDDSSAKLYADGKLVVTVPATNFESTKRTMTGNVYLGDNGCEAYLNDFRIYDHCLSPMEVKELSKGLVLHYPLNRQGWGQENLWSQTENASLTAANASAFKIENGGFTATASKNDFYTNGILYNTTSYYGASNGQLFTLDSTSAYTLTVTNPIFNSALITYLDSNKKGLGYKGLSKSKSSLYTDKSVWIIPTSMHTSGATYFLIRVGYTASVAGETYSTKIKLEKGSVPTPWCPNSSDALATTMGLNSTTEYDCSGFCNNGIRTGTFTWTSDTPKYAVSTAIEKGIVTSTNSFITTADPIFSVALWFKLKSGVTYTAFTDLISFSTSSYSNQPFRLEICGSPVGKDIAWYRGPSGQSGGFRVGSNLSFDTWYHTVLVSEGNKQYTYYLNGERKGTYNGSANSWTPTGNVSLGENIAGVIYESDVRIYATALSASDVKSLYQNSAYIDSSGNVYGAVHSEV